MKIQKKQKITACGSALPVVDNVSEFQPTDNLLITEEVSSKEAASKLILEAIDCLSHVADKDAQARNSIADLGVVLLDLK